MRAGRELTVINLSSTGVLLDGEARLLPGRHLDVHVVIATGRTLVRSRVVRSSVEGLWSDRVLYRGALAFEHSLDFGPVTTQVNEPSLVAAGNPLPTDDEGVPGSAGITYPQTAMQA